MRLLALDASTEQLCVAVVVDGVVVRGGHEVGGAAASQRLLPLARELLLAPLAATPVVSSTSAAAGEADSSLFAEVGAVAVAVGPGAFTGIRSACSAAQGLALGLGLQVVPIDSLQIVAEASWDPESPNRLVGVAMDARMQQVYDSVYRRTEGGWELVQEPQVRGPEEAAQDWLNREPVPQIWVGSGVALMGPDALGQAEQAGVRIGRGPDLDERVQALGRCAWQAWSAGVHCDAAQVVPRYVRDRVALTTNERELQARAQMQPQTQTQTKLQGQGQRESSKGVGV